MLRRDCQIEEMIFHRATPLFVHNLSPTDVTVVHNLSRPL